MIGGGCGASGAVNDSSPRDNLSISAPNACNAVIVDGVGSGILPKTKQKIWLMSCIYFSKHDYNATLILVAIIREY